MKKNLIVLTFLILLTSGTGALAKTLKIVSLAPSLTQNLQYMGAEKDIIGCTSYCQPSTKKQVVASAIKVNVEKVVALKPDLVVATTLTNKDNIKALKKFGLNVVVYHTAKSFEEICSQFMDLGKRTGREIRAKQVIQETRQRVNRSKNQPHKPFTIFMQIGADPLFTVIPNTFMNDFITFAGAKNIAWDLKMGTITRETVIKRNPDVIFIVTMGMMGESERKQWLAARSLNATKNKRIYILDSNKACTPSPVSFAETLDKMVRLLQ